MFFMGKKSLFLLAVILLFTQWGFNVKDFKEITFQTSDEGIVEGSVFGDYSSESGVVLVHGMVFNRESWYDFAKLISTEGFCALSINLRGYGNSVQGKGGKEKMYPDVLGAAEYLRQRGVKKICVVGASLGALAAIDAALNDNGKVIDRIILLSPPPHNGIRNIKVPKLFLYSKDEGLADNIKKMFDKADGEKKIKSFNGNAHAQHIFKTDNRKELENELIAFIKQN